MYDHPFDRKFGIEFEFNCRSIEGMRIPDMEPERDRYGYMVGPDKYSKFRRILKDNGLEDFVVGGDGSEYEIKTPILQGPTGFKRVKRFLDLMSDLGAAVSLNADGLHVHHDAPEFFDPETLQYHEAPVMALVENWVENQEQIYPMVNNCRVGRMACVPWRTDDLALLKSDFRTYSQRMGRKNLNIASLRRHGTIEIRLHEGTLDYEETLSWVRFGQAFIGKAVAETDRNVSVNSSEELLRNIKVSRNASRFLSRKMNATPVNAW